MTKGFINWKRLRFKYDNSNRYEDLTPYEFPARELLLNAVKINEYLSPQIANVIKSLKKELDLHHEINVYVKSNPNINAYSFCGIANEMNILLTSALVNIMTIDELKFVISHECAHILFEHHKSYKEGLSDEAKRFLDNAREISCDRLAHSSVDSPMSSYSALLKIESGLSQDKLNLNVREYLLEYKALYESDLLYSSSQSSHPFANTRIRSLLLFESSNLYYDIKQYNDSSPSDINRIEVKIADDIIMNGFVRLDLIEKDLQDKLIFWTDFLSVLNKSQNKDQFLIKYGIERLEMGVSILKTEGQDGIRNRIFEKRKALENGVYLI